MARAPRRLNRFYRQQERSREDYEDDSRPSERGRKKSKEEMYDDVERLPTMDYEDVDIDDRNLNEIQKVEQYNLEEKLALLEVKKFKKEKKRLPNKEEAEKIADTLYTQFKEQPLMEESLVRDGEGKSRGRRERPSKEERRAEKEQRRNDRRNRHGRRRNNEEENEMSNIPGEREEGFGKEDLKKDDIKDLFGGIGASNGNKKEKIGIDKDAFNLNIGLGDEKIDGKDEFEELQNLDEEKEVCSSCGEETEKILYCPKCGQAYCKKCAKKEKGITSCPKCGTKSSL